MSPQRSSAKRSWLAKIAVAGLVGLAVAVLLYPASGIDIQPPLCFSAFGYSVPCGGGWALAAVVAATAGAGLVLWTGRRRGSI